MQTRRTTLCIAVALAWSCSGSVTGVDRGSGSVASIDLTPSSVTLAVGAEAPLQATVRDESGLALTGVTLVWSVKDTAIASVSPIGVVKARSVGNTQVAVSARGVSAIATLTVLPPPVASVLVQPLSRTLVLGESATFTATARDVNGSPLSGRIVSWNSSDAGVATVSQSGEVATHGVGTTTITATSEGASGSATVTVLPVPVASVAVQPSSASLSVGGSLTLGADIRDASGAPLDRAVIWSSDNSAVASVSTAGVVSALSPGSATITAQSEGKSGTAIISVSRAPVASISVTPGGAALVVGSSVSLVPTVKDVSGTVLTDRVVSWTSSDIRVAVVSTAGVVTAVAPGSATISATSEGISGTSVVTVVPPAIASVTVQPDSATIQVGASTTFTTTVKDATGAVVGDREVVWTSGNVAVATVSATGIVTGHAVGTATISATSGGRSGSASVTVVPVPVGSVTVSPTSVTLVPTQVTALAVVVRDANDVVVTDRTVSWSSSNTAVAVVSSNGAVTAVAPGVATVTATSEGRSGSASITVVPVPVGSVTVNPPTSSVTVGQTVALAATVRDTSGTPVTDRAVTWSSSDETIATVSSAGVVTGMSAGTATITATSEGKSGSAAVTVLPVPVATVTLEPTSVRLEPGQTATLVATTKSADGTVLTGRVVTFASDNVDVARISSDGVVTGVAPGTATITATSEGQSATATVTVQPTVAFVIVAPSTVFLRRNNTVQLSVTAYDAAGHVIVGRAVTWSSADDRVATVSDTGVVTGRHAGVVTISATIDGKSGSTQVTVTN